MAAGSTPGGSRRGAKRSPVHDDVGRRLRAHRERSQISLRELARRLEISPSAISQIETGKSRPSVSTLYAIVTELGTSLDELFSGSAQPKPGRSAPAAPARARAARTAPPPAEATGGHVQRAAGRKTIDLESGVRWERLTPSSDPEADFLYVTYDVGGSSSQGDRRIRHSGREYGLVVSGALEVAVGFDTYVLGPGDSICFDSTVPHCLRNVGTEPVHGVWFVTGRQQGDRRTLEFEGADGSPPAPGTH